MTLDGNFYQGRTQEFVQRGGGAYIRKTPGSIKLLCTPLIHHVPNTIKRIPFQYTYYIELSEEQQLALARRLGLHIAKL